MSINSNPTSDKAASPVFSEFLPPIYDEWAKSVNEATSGKTPEKLASNTYEGIKTKPIYNQEDINSFPSLINSFPGSTPFIRGTHLLPYKFNNWKISQPIISQSAGEFNIKALKSIRNGQTALSINPIASSILNAKDWRIAIKDIDLKTIQVDIFANEKASDYYDTLCKSLQDYPGLQKLSGGLDFCPLSIAAENGGLENDLDFIINQAALISHQALKNTPLFRIFSVNTTPFHNAGANALQELAYALSMAVVYMKSLINSGLSPDNASSQIRFIVASGENFFMEIAKFRVLRRLWAKVAMEFGCSEEYQKSIIFAITTQRNKSHLDPYVNLLRNTTESLSAILGGCDTLQIAFFDEGIRQIGEFSERVSRNMQIVLQEECNLADTSDPAGGSWYIEYLSEEIAQRAWKHFQELEKIGGFQQALQQSYVQNEIEEIRLQRLKNLSSRKDVLVGTNMYANLDESDLCDGSKTNQSVFISNKIKKEVNSFKIKSLEQYRSPDEFEKLRKTAMDYKRKNGDFPKVLLLNYGSLRDYKARADFSSDFFAVGGFKAERSESFTNYEEIAAKAINSDCNLLVFCSTDEKYLEFVEQSTRLIKQTKPLKTIILAGYPKENIDVYQSAGVDFFIHLRADIVKTLSDLQKLI